MTRSAAFCLFVAMQLIAIALRPYTKTAFSLWFAMEYMPNMLFLAAGIMLGYLFWGIE